MNEKKSSSKASGIIIRDEHKKLVAKFDTQKIIDNIFAGISKSQPNELIEGESYNSMYSLLTKDDFGSVCSLNINITYEFNYINKEYEQKEIVKSKVQRFELIISPIKQLLKFLVVCGLGSVIDNLVGLVFRMEVVNDKGLETVPFFMPYIKYSFSEK